MQTIMKRIKTTGSFPVEVICVPEQRADKLVASGEYTWATRTEWKKAGKITIR